MKIFLWYNQHIKDAEREGVMRNACIAWIVGMLVLSAASCQDYVCLFLDEPIEEDGGGLTDGEEVSPCEGVDCSGHGTCEVQQGVPVCVCDAGYHAEGLDCVEDCQPNCQGKCCGTDGCGGTCPNRCPDTGQTCNLQTCGCEGPCQPNCQGKDCGPDGCGDNCPPGCEENAICVSGTCQQDPSALVWVEIPGGTFMMGSENGDDNEQPVHRVDVPTFEITKTEITVSQYQACFDASVCTQPNEYPECSYCNWGVDGREDHPINCVEWNQADVFCRWWGGQLPTEAQWEYAARGGGENIEYPWGDQTATCQYTVMDDHEAGGDGCGQDRTWSVCSRTTGNTAHGICDMSGNVYEWVQDQYHDSYIDAPTDGSSWESPQYIHGRVCRGSCFKSSDPLAMRASFRTFYINPSRADGIIGIRCVRPVDP